MVPGRKYSIESILSLLWSRKVWLAVTVLLGTAAANLYVSRIPNSYRAQATILVLPQLVPQNYVRASVTQDLDDRLRTLSERVLSLEPLSAIARDLNLYPDLGPSDAAVAAQRIISKTSLEPIRADAFRIAFLDPNPKQAAQVVNRLARAFVEENLRSRTGMAEETDQFLNGLLTSARDRLVEHEKRLEDYRRAYSGQLPSQLSSNLQVIQNAQLQLRTLADSIHQDRDQKLKVEQMIAALKEPDVPPDPAQTDPAPVEEFDPLSDKAPPVNSQDALRALPGARAALQRLQLELKPEHPDIVRLKRVVAELERRAQAEPVPVKPPKTNDAVRAARLNQLMTELATIEQRLIVRQDEEAQLRDVITRYQQRVELSPTRETELTTLMRDYDTLRESYKGLLAKKEQSEMGAELERRQVGETMKIIEGGRVSDKPFSPDRPRALLIGALAGLLLTVFGIGWVEYRDSTLRTESEVVSALNLPVMALIGIIEDATARRRARLRRVAVVSVAGLLVSVAVILLYRFAGF